jgi:hypothetical protein
MSTTSKQESISQRHVKATHSPGDWVLEGEHVVARDEDGLATANQSNSVAKLFGPDAEANGRLISAASKLFSERQAISAALGKIEWATPAHAEQILSDFIEKFCDSDAVDKATGIDRAIEKMAASKENRCDGCGWKFIVTTPHNPEMDFICPHCGKGSEE